MHFITLDHETDFEGWRKAARALVLQRCEPVRRDVDRARRRRRNCSRLSPQHRCPKCHTAPSVSRPNSSNWRSPRSCIAIIAAFRDPVSAAVAAAQPSRSAGGRDRSRCCAGCGDGKSRAPRRAQDARLCPLSRNRPRAEHRVTSPGSSRNITSSRLPRRSSRAALPTWPGRS